MSEVQRLRQQIEAEYQAAQQAVHGYATVARHEFINARMSRIDEHRRALEQAVGSEEAMKILIEINDKLAPSQLPHCQTLYCISVNNAVVYFGISQQLAEEAWKQAVADPSKRVVVTVNGKIEAVREVSIS